MPVEQGDTSVDTSAQAKIARMLSDDLMIGEDTLVPEEDTPPAKESQPTPDAEDAEVEEPVERPEDQEDDEDAEPAPTPQAKRKLKVGDDELDEDEVVKGYLRQSDYTRKSQANADLRKEFEAKDLKRQELEATYAERLKELEENIKAQTPQEPDWDKLRAEKPELFAATVAEWQIYRQRMEKLAEARKVADAKVQENETKAMTARSEAAAQRLLELLPEWKDETTMRKDAQAIAQLVEPLGITKAELAGLQRPELFVLLRKAAQFDALQAQIREGRIPPSKKAPKVDADLPASGRMEERNGPGKEFERDFKKAAKSGKPEDAARAIRHMLD